jgi:hypothetical protein
VLRDGQESSEHGGCGVTISIWLLGLHLHGVPDFTKWDTSLERQPEFYFLNTIAFVPGIEYDLLRDT